MPLSVQCPNCGKSYRVGDDSLGVRARCKNCEHSFTISTSDSETINTRPPEPDEASGEYALAKPAESGSTPGTPPRRIPRPRL